ncbi:PRD domain-containing protein [Ruania zhangjianzhongii]|uniref:PRD domain-containing protein n=1 Tax=Ruania zhangjianzhongii TaxID=2603206 RepID=UPI0011C869CC|nr:PRD domain-containing protein [Ruania zhangjianzhongii]
MDPTLQERLDIFRAMPAVPDEAVDLVAAELTRLDPAQTLTDDQAGSFVSHAVNALARLSAGDVSVEAPSDTVYQQVRDEDPQAEERARAFVERVQARLGRALPEAELKFITIHFAALAQHTRKEHP